MRAIHVRQAQRGLSLIESLIAFLVLSVGLVGMSRLQTQLRLNADLARQRTEAVRLAQEDIETLRSFSTTTSATGSRSYTQVVSGAWEAGAAGGLRSNTDYTVERSVDEGTGFRSAHVAVAWPDRSGQPRAIVLDAVIAATPPAFSGALTAQGATQMVKRLQGRSAFIPWDAKTLDNSKSVFKPTTSGTTLLVFDNATGAVSQVCALSAATLTADVTSADLTQCTATAGMLLSGIVRVSLATPPDSAHANDTPLPLNVHLTLDSGAAPVAPSCFSEAQKMVAIATSSGTRRQAVPLAATPASMGERQWTETGERFVAYHCVVPPIQGVWSGRSTLEPQGWTLGSASDQYKVCRYSADQDGSGAVDSNAEHPEHYSQVDRSLMQQNFLIVRGNQACPNAADTHAGEQGVSGIDHSTVQHQP